MLLAHLPTLFFFPGSAPTNIYTGSQIVVVDAAARHQIQAAREQALRRQKIHPFQYLMVGAALCLLYLLLLSISQCIGFGWAYLIVAAASTILITWYCRYSSVAEFAP